MTDDVLTGADTSRQDVPAVRGEALKVVYRRRTVLDVGSVTVQPGETYALLGASGAGKSTLLRVLGLLERPTEGHVYFDGNEARATSLAARRTIAAVFQKPFLLRGSVAYNVGYGLKLRRVPRAERKSRVSEALAGVGLAGWEGRPATTLSGGEAQRVALARALVLRPSFLLLDEPLSYLDPLLKRELTREFARILASEHLTALYVTHDQDEAAVVADRIGVMREGRIIAEGEPDDILGLPADEWLAAFVGMEPPLRGTVVASVDGLAEIDCDGVKVFASTSMTQGTEVMMAVRPEDISLYPSGAKLPAGSPRNVLDVAITDVLPQGGSVHYIVEQGGFRVAASISRTSATELGLRAGGRATAVFKATAVRVRAV